MTISLRRLARSHCLRTMAVLAWLMLVSTSLAAAPMLMGTDGAPHAMQTTSSHQHHVRASLQQAPTLAADMFCCNDPMAPDCSCHSLCGIVLSPVSVLAPAPMMFATTYAPSFDQRTLAPNTVPPLRPPSV